MEYWAKPRVARDQIVLFSPTLDASISNDHPVRLLNEILKGLDWSAWEAEYDGQKGQPPIPPWVMAGVILYGLMRGLRSSRMLEYLCGHNVDFLWLAEGRIIDHTTLCKFRTRFRGPLKELFRQLGKLSLQMGLKGNPAKRSDPRQAVAEEERGKLPRNDKQKLAKSCFVYDEESDRYYCPMGRRLDYKETNKDQRGGTARRVGETVGRNGRLGEAGGAWANEDWQYGPFGCESSHLGRLEPIGNDAAIVSKTEELLEKSAATAA
jgi:transposase